MRKRDRQIRNSANMLQACVPQKRILISSDIAPRVIRKESLHQKHQNVRSRV